MNRTYISLAVASLLGLVSLSAVAQETTAHKRSLELGLGADMLSISRVAVNGGRTSALGNHYSIKLRNAMFGGSLYAAHELCRWVYVDLQGTLGAAETFANGRGESRHKLFALTGVGLQLRLTPLFKTNYVEPYLRVGGNWLYKGFGIERSAEWAEGASWQHSDRFNEGADMRRHEFPISLGFGVNSWFNDHIGFGIQGDYLTSFTSHRLSFPRVQARVMVRWSAPKSRKTEVQYVEKIVPEERIVEKVVERTGKALALIFEGVNFEFDQSEITAEAARRLDAAASILKQFPEQHFLITGFTDAKGGDKYNEVLSKRRADAVVSALVERGIPADMLKSAGVGSRATTVAQSESDAVREGDRKVTIEPVSNMDYWQKLP